MTESEYVDATTGEVIQRNDIETRAGVESLEWLNAEIAKLMKEFAPLSNLFRGTGEAANAARKRHRAVIGKRIEVDHNAKKGSMDLAQPTPFPGSPASLGRTDD